MGHSRRGDQREEGCGVMPFPAKGYPHVVRRKVAVGAAEDSARMKQRIRRTEDRLKIAIERIKDLEAALLVLDARVDALEAP